MPQMGRTTNILFTALKRNCVGLVLGCLGKGLSLVPHSSKQSRKPKTFGGIPLPKVKNVMVLAFVIFIDKTTRIMLYLWENFKNRMRLCLKKHSGLVIARPPQRF